MKLTARISAAMLALTAGLTAAVAADPTYAPGSASASS